MSLLKEFSYSNANQRKLIYYNSFLSLASLGFIFSDLWLKDINFYFYFPVARVIFISLLTGLFFGNLAGRILFRVIPDSRLMYVAAEFLFILSSIFYFIKGQVLPSGNDPLMFLFNYSPYMVPLLIMVPGFFAGIKINYFLKISCANFIDEKQGIVKFLFFSLIGFIFGMTCPWGGIISGMAGIWDNYFHLFSAISGLIIPAMLFINLPYNPRSQFIQHYSEKDQTEPISNYIKENLLFIYLNFCYVIIYIYLSLESIIKIYGDNFYIKFAFIIIALLGISGGFICGNVLRSRLFYIYIEMIFPVLILPCIYMLNIYKDGISFLLSLLIFLPAFFIFGFSLLHTVKNVMGSYDYQKRYFILDISLMVIPLPVIAALNYIKFNYIIYFIFLYLLAIMNILIPGISILGMTIKGYKKILYFVFSFIILLGVIFSHNYFKIKFSTDIYAARTRNYDELKSVNYNAVFIKNKSSVYYNGSVIFNISDSIIRNLKRSLVPLFLFADHKKDDKILFLDGNQKFFRNPVIGYFSNAICLDLLSDENVDYNRLPVSGKQSYVTEKEYLLFYLNKEQKKFSTIVDIPNIYDQNYNLFRFSNNFYTTIREKLKKDGIFGQVFNINDGRKEFFYELLNNHKKNFKKSIVFMFSNVMIIISSDNAAALTINQKKFDMLAEAFNRHDELGVLFYNDIHVLSYLISTDINLFLQQFSSARVPRLFFLMKPMPVILNDFVIKEFTDNNSLFLNLAENVQENYAFINSISGNSSRSNMLYSLIKKTELAESKDNYEDETMYLFQLNSFTDFRMNFKKYLSNILSYKEEYYYNTGLRLENEKRWKEARSLYKASLTINGNNFNTNYRLGLLCIILQDFENAFTYFNQALMIDRNHPKVFYQLGVLLFTGGKIQEAINYFNRAVELRENSASLFLYLGLSYEKMNMLQDAENYYTRALLLDPNDQTIISRVESLKVRKEEERNKWKTGPLKNETEAEMGEKMPLPINKAALDWRLSDKEAESMKDGDK